MIFFFKFFDKLLFKFNFLLKEVSKFSIKLLFKLFSLFKELNDKSNEFAFALLSDKVFERLLLKYSLIDPIFLLIGFIFILFALDISK